jgi:hypothetical protein
MENRDCGTDDPDPAERAKSTAEAVQTTRRTRVGPRICGQYMARFELCPDLRVARLRSGGPGDPAGSALPRRLQQKRADPLQVHRAGAQVPNGEPEPEAAT